MYTKELMNHIGDYLRRIIELQVLDVTKTKDRGKVIHMSFVCVFVSVNKD